MALPTPNTDPGKGRVTTTTSGDGAALTNETSKMAKGINDIEDVISKRLDDISGFLEIMKNYIHLIVRILILTLKVVLKYISLMIIHL